MQRWLTAVALAVLIVTSGVPAIADHLAPGDVERSAEAVERLRLDWVDAETAYERALAAHAAAIERARAADTDVKLASAEYRESRDEARSRLVTAYTAGANPGLPTGVESAAAEQVYRSIVSGRDAETLARLESRRDALRRAEERRATMLAPTQTAVEAARHHRDERRAAFEDAAEAHLALVAHWEAQELERLRREEEARRKAEEERLAAEAAAAAEAAEAARLAEERAARIRVATAHSPRVERWRPLVKRYFPPELVDEAMMVMACESSGDPKATNPETGAGGLFQHMPSYWKRRAREVGFAGASVYEPEPNVAAAAALALWSRERHFAGTWGYWSCQPDGTIVD